MFKVFTIQWHSGNSKFLGLDDNFDSSYSGVPFIKRYNQLGENNDFELTTVLKMRLNLDFWENFEKFWITEDVETLLYILYLNVCILSCFD